MCLQAATGCLMGLPIGFPSFRVMLSPFCSIRCKHSYCCAKLISLGLSSSLIFRGNSLQFFSCRWRCGFQLVLEVHEYERQRLFSHSPLKLEMMIFPANKHTLISTVTKHSWEHRIVLQNLLTTISSTVPGKLYPLF